LDLPSQELSPAVRHLELSVKNDPNNPNSRTIWAWYLASGDSVKAKKALQRALSQAGF
jgi:hypothetical protein